MVKIHMINKSSKFRLMVKGDLNVGMVLLLPEGFELGGSCSRTNEKKVGKLYYQPYSQNNILVVGPVAGNEYNEMVILSFLQTHQQIKRLII
jgi:hypothetical protein